MNAISVFFWGGRAGLAILSIDDWWAWPEALIGGPGRGSDWWTWPEALIGGPGRRL